jgi:hypothetical protein
MLFGGAEPTINKSVVSQTRSKESHLELSDYLTKITIS